MGSNTAAARNVSAAPKFRLGFIDTFNIASVRHYCTFIQYDGFCPVLENQQHDAAPEPMTSLFHAIFPASPAERTRIAL